MGTGSSHPGEAVDLLVENAAAPTTRQCVTWRLGIQGKLVISFTLLIVMALTISCWFYFYESRKEVARHSAQQVVQLANLLGMSAGPSLQSGNRWTLEQVCREVMKNLDL